MNSNKSKKNNLFLLLIFICATFSILTQSTVLLVGYAFLIFIISIVNFKLGVFTWILVAPITSSIEISFIFQIYSIALIIPYLFKLLSKKELIRKSILNKHISITFILLLLSSLIFYQDYFHVLILILGVLVTTFIVFQQSTKSKLGLTFIINGMILSGLIAVFYAFSIRGDNITRLGIGDNVRSLANIINFSLAFIFYFYILKNNRNLIEDNIFTKYIHRLKWVLIVFLGVGLFATISRGAIISIVISLIFMFLIDILVNIRKLDAKKIIYTAVVLVIVLFVSFNYGADILNSFNVSSGFVEARFSEENIQSGSSIRTQIWISAISQLEGLQLYIGHGISSFNYLSEKAGFTGFYSHSVFVDTLVSTGVIGLLSLMSIFMYIFYYSFKNKQFSILSLLLLLVLNFATHGGISSGMFWYFLAILCSLTYNVKKEPV